MAETIRNFTTRCKCSDGDWKTQLAVGYADIPEGHRVLFDKLWVNGEGVWARVHWQGRAYNVRPDALVIKTREVIKNVVRNFVFRTVLCYNIDTIIQHKEALCRFQKYR